MGRWAQARKRGSTPQAPGSAALLAAPVETVDFDFDSSTSDEIDFVSFNGAHCMVWRYRLSGAPGWLSGFVMDPLGPGLVGGLGPELEYEFQFIFADCDEPHAALSDWSASAFWSTTA